MTSQHNETPLKNTAHFLPRDVAPMRQRKQEEGTSGAASLLVDYDVVVPSTGGAAFRTYFRDRRSAAEDLGDMSRGFPAGSLVVYLVDAQTRELAYRGGAFDVIADDASPARVDDAVARMLAAVPAVSDARSAGSRGQ